jgi:hypothetical protein
MLNTDSWNWGAKAGFFWAGTGMLCAVWTYFRVPEPKGRTYAEMDMLFEARVSARKFRETSVEAFGTAGDVDKEAYGDDLEWLRSMWTRCRIRSASIYESRVIVQKMLDCLNVQRSGLFRKLSYPFKPFLILPPSYCSTLRPAILFFNHEGTLSCQERYLLPSMGSQLDPTAVTLSSASNRNSRNTSSSPRPSFAVI